MNYYIPSRCKDFLSEKPRVTRAWKWKCSTDTLFLLQLLLSQLGFLPQPTVDLFLLRERTYNHILSYFSLESNVSLPPIAVILDHFFFKVEILQCITYQSLLESQPSLLCCWLPQVHQLHSFTLYSTYTSFQPLVIIISDDPTKIIMSNNSIKLHVYLSTNFFKHPKIRQVDTNMHLQDIHNWILTWCSSKGSFSVYTFRKHLQIM